MGHSPCAFRRYPPSTERWASLPVSHTHDLQQMIAENTAARKEPLTGRAVIWPKRTVESSKRLDLLDLQRLGVLDAPDDRLHVVTWSRKGKPVGTIGCRLGHQPDGRPSLQLRYRLSDRSGNSLERRIDVELEATPCHFGGQRWWFLCPSTKHGRPCHRRCRVLYLPSGETGFACRDCHQLTYQCRQLHRDWFYETVTKPQAQVDRLRGQFRRAPSPELAEAIRIKQAGVLRAMDEHIGRLSALMGGFIEEPEDQ